MSYVLKSEAEVTRLRSQSESKSYSVKDELININIEDGSSIIEVGCGAGTLTWHLINNFNVKASACDLVENHVLYCDELFEGRVEVFQHDIVDFRLPEKYDYIFMRYVPHHLGEENFKKAVRNMKAALRKNGQLVIIDVDGMFQNLGTTNKELKMYIKKLTKDFPGNFELGRNIASILESEGFSDIQSRIDTIHFNGREKDLEIEQMRERFSFANKLLIEIFGSELIVKRFEKIFLEELENPFSVYFINKFIVSAKVY